jgi:pimeloyl-ACP methyl ester carboxylesterase
MPIDARLTFCNVNDPEPWILYSHAVLNNLVYVGNLDLIQQWAAWAGGANVHYFPRGADYPVDWVVIEDGTRAIISIAGTVGALQAVRQIVASSIAADPLRAGDVSEYQLSCVYRIADRLNTILTPLPNTAPLLLCGHSLGGGIAQIFAARRINGQRPLITLITMGQPRSGARSLQNNTTTNYVRVVNQGDPVAGIPPESTTLSVLGSVAPLGFANFDYRHGGTYWELTPTSLNFGVDAPTGSTLQAFGRALGDGVEFQNSIQVYHSINVYATNVYAQIIQPPLFIDMTVVVNLNRIANNEAPQAAQRPVAPIVPPLPPPNVVAAPVLDFLVNPPALPPDALNQPVQLIEAPFHLFVAADTNPILSGAFGMASVAKVTFNFLQRGYGWTETYYRAGGLADSADRAILLGNQLIKFRGQTCGITRYRVSIINVPVTFPKPRSSRPFVAPNSWAQGTAGVDDKAADFSDTCLLMICLASVPNVAAKYIYWRGIPDEIVVNGGNVRTGGMTFFGAATWNALQSELSQGGWGWLGTVGTGKTQVKISGLAQTAGTTGFVNFTFETPLFAGATPVDPAPGYVVPIRISQVRTPGNINGVIPVTVGPTTSQATSKNRISILTWDGVSGKATYTQQALITFAPPAVRGTLPNIDIARVGERRAGVPTGQPRGRQRNRIRA